MIGPVLYQEMLLGARRNRAYFFRWFYAAWILLQFGGMLFINIMSRLGGMRRGFDNAAVAEFCRDYLDVLIPQHYLVLLLATPVLAAGAITDEKWRGTLQYLLVTELFSWEILLGKLIGRLYQVFLIALTPWPLICFLGVFGGLDLTMLLCLAISSLVMAFAIGSMTLLSSVLCRHTRDAVLALYMVGAIVYGGAVGVQALIAHYGGRAPSWWLTWLDTILNCLDPLHPLGTGWSMDDPAERARRVLASVLAWGLLGLVSLALATLQLRSAYLRYLEHADHHRWWPVVLVSGCIWTAFGLAMLAPYLLATGEIWPYLDGTSRSPWNTSLMYFLLGWNAVAIAPLLVGIVVLSVKGRSQMALQNLHALRQRNWFTRRASLAGDPIRWKERHVEGVAPLASLRAMPRWLGMALTFVGAAAVSMYLLSQHLAARDNTSSILSKLLEGDYFGLLEVQERMASCDGSFFYLGFTVMLLAGLMIAIRCSGAVTGEREKNTWEALLLTPLETRELIRGKLWGIIGASMPYLVAYALPVVALSALGGLAALFWTGVWLAVTLLAMFFVGAAGLWCSVRAKTSWRSLLGTLGIAYVGGFILFCVTSPIMLMVAVILFIAINLVQQQLGVRVGGSFAEFFTVFSLGMCITLAGAFAFMAWRFVASAEYRVSVLERTKHWRDEPKHPRWSRHARERRHQLPINKTSSLG